jgi:phosphoserine phosphatase
VSTGFTDMIAAIGQTVGAQIAVGSDLEMRDGRCTGRVTGPIVIGAQKGVAAKAKLAQLGYEVDYAHSFAYADSITDMGLFDCVGNPRPVYPDAELAKVAATRGWVTTKMKEEG